MDKTPRDLILRLWRSQTGMCPLCGRGLDQVRFHVDHKVAVVNGGRHEERNLQLTHPRCNLKKGKK